MPLIVVSRAALRFGLVLVVLAISPGALRAQETGPEMLLELDASRALLAQGRTATLDLRLDEAEVAFRRLQNQPDGVPAALHHLATVAILRGFLTDDERHFFHFVARSDSLKAALAAHPASRWRTYLEAETDLQRAIVWARQEKLSRSALAARSAYNGFQRALRGAPQFHEAKKGMGLLHLMIGSAPRAYRWVLRVLGFGGSVERGLAELRHSAAESRYNREESLLLLGLIDVIVLGNPEDGVKRVQGLARERTASPLVQHVYGFALLSSRRAVEAERTFRHVYEAGRRNGVMPVPFSEYYLADALFKQNRFGEAERHFKEYLRKHRGPSLRSAALLSLGIALEMQNKRAEALPYYRQIKHSRISETEEAAVRRAKRRLAAPMGPSEQNLLRAQNLFEAGLYPEARRTLEALLSRRDLTADERGEANFRLGRVHHVSNRPQDALRHYEAAWTAPGDDSLNGWAPWSRFHAGELMEELGNRAEARVHYEAALRSEGNFDFYLSLEQNAKAGLERVKGRTG